MSDEIGIAVIGAGHWGPNLIRNFHDGAGSSVRRVVDTDPRRLQEVARRFPDVQVGERAGEAIGDAAVDAVVIATPTITHYRLAEAALEAGKHVLVEKPLAARGDEAARLCELAAAKDRVLMVGHVFVYNEGVRRVKQFLDDGELGRLFYISMTRTNLGPIRMDVNAAWDLAAHDVSIANHWLEAQPLSVSATGGSWINEGIADAVFATLRYPDDVLVHLHTSWLHPDKNRTISVVGERRMLTFDDLSLTEPIRIHDRYVSEERTLPGFVDTFASFRASVREGEIRIPKVSMGEPLRAECAHFVECVQDGKTPRSAGPEGLEVVRVLEALDRSAAASGREETVES